MSELNNSETMIEVVDLHKRFKDLHVLNGISTVVKRSEVVAIMGPSGSGKSTFLRCLNRLEEPSSGHIYIEGVDILARRPQLQERLTGQIADAIIESLSPDGVAVVIEAEHLCMTMRGVQKPGTTLITSALRGAFRRRAVTRSEFMALVRGG